MPRPATQSLAFGAVRWYFELEACLARLLERPGAKQDPELRALLLVGLFQLRHGATPAHAAVSETVEATRALGRSRAAGLVNATPVGMLGMPGLPVSLDSVRASHWVADVIYTPLETELIKGARAKGSKVMGGAGMCVHQAAESFRLFTGLPPDTSRMQRTFVRAAVPLQEGCPQDR